MTNAPIPNADPRKHIPIGFAAAGVLALHLSAVQAATVVGTNYNVEAMVHKPVATANGNAIATGGVVLLGSFTSTGPAFDTLIAGLGSPAGLSALLSDFIAFGISTSFGGAGGGFEGLYDLPAVDSIALGHPLVGKAIHTFIGNGATLAASTEIGIIRHEQIFAAEPPDFLAFVSMFDATNVYYLCTPNGPVLAANNLFPAAAALQLTVPEPAAVILLVMGMAMGFSRGR